MGRSECYVEHRRRRRRNEIWQGRQRWEGCESRQGSQDRRSQWELEWRLEWQRQRQRRRLQHHTVLHHQGSPVIRRILRPIRRRRRIHVRHRMRIERRLSRRSGMLRRLRSAQVLRSHVRRCRRHVRHQVRGRCRLSRRSIVLRRHNRGGLSRRRRRELLRRGFRGRQRVESGMQRRRTVRGRGLSGGSVLLHGRDDLSVGGQLLREQSRGCRGGVRGEVLVGGGLSGRTGVLRRSRDVRRVRGWLLRGVVRRSGDSVHHQVRSG
mmetsp:Transcript_5554/g.12103  ORF Transcript_5554/g.12103 Transcript_5554/m.12103 type:complete len:265 (+) Transcript_5554:318-1112(+)